MDRIPFGHRTQPAPVSTPPNSSYRPGLRLLPAPSQQPRHAEALASEVALHWPRPASKAPPWLRESFQNRRPPASVLWAFTTDSRNRVVRAFTAAQRSIAAYAAGGCGQFGPITCPIESVWPPSIAVGLPAEPAHPYVLQRLGADSLIHRHAERLGLIPEQLSAALLQYAAQELADWTETAENNDPGSVWCVGDAPDFLLPHLPKRFEWGVGL